MRFLTRNFNSDFLPILMAGSVILIVSFGIRSSFGVFLPPITAEFGWPRETFSMAIAIQNLAWGFGQPVFGALAEKVGDRKTLLLGILCYGGGLMISAMGGTALAQFTGAGVLIGLGVAGTGFGVVLAIVGRAANPEKRSLALGVATAAGSLGQILTPPLAQILETYFGWSAALLLLSLLLVLILPFALRLKAPPAASQTEPGESMGRVVRQAVGDLSYICLFLGFFVCGFQLAFITAHFPAYVAEVCGSVSLGAITLAIIGAANIVGTIVAGQLGDRYPKKYLLSLIYFLRALVTFAFISIPPTAVSVVIFSALMGLLWLATVPVTSAAIAQIFGPRYMGTLYGIVFVSHQLGSFLGVWLGGKLYDITGGYDTVWWVAIGLAIFSTLIHFPVDERPRLIRAAA